MQDEHVEFYTRNIPSTPIDLSQNCDAVGVETFYYRSGTSFAFADALYTNSATSRPAKEGYYSDGAIVRFFDGYVFVLTESCTAIVVDEDVVDDDSDNSEDDDSEDDDSEDDNSEDDDSEDDDSDDDDDSEDDDSDDDGSDDDGKSYVCHVKGNGDTQTLYLPQAAIQAHLNHGDSLGECED